jgi:FixJ family two-component response regulator
MICGPVVYVVDDDDPVRDAVRMLFRTADLDVETFSSADAFLEQADLGRRWRVLLDIRVPRVTGTDLHDELLQRGARAGDLHHRPRRHPDGGAGDAQGRVRLHREAVR